METYPVVWSETSGRPSAGKLELEVSGIRLEGGDVRSVAYGEIERVHIGRRLSERVLGKPALVLDLVSGGVLAIASLGGPGTLNELAEHLAPRLVA